MEHASWLMVAALRCVRPQIQWFQLAYATEKKSIQLHDSIEGLSQKIASYTLHYIHLTGWALYCWCRLGNMDIELENIAYSFATQNLFTEVCPQNWPEHSDHDILTMPFCPRHIVHDHLTMPFCPRHFVYDLLSVTLLSTTFCPLTLCPRHFVHYILSVTFCPMTFCPHNILSATFCPWHFVRWHFVLEPLDCVMLYR